MKLLSWRSSGWRSGLVIALFAALLAVFVFLFNSKSATTLAVCPQGTGDVLQGAENNGIPDTLEKNGWHQSLIEVGPIDLHKKYRSMEGPYAIQKFRISDLLASGKVKIPESRIVYLDTPNSTPAPSMQNSTGGNGSPCDLEGLADTGDKERELLWFRGIKLEVLDENDRPMPTAEFICHMNLDVDQVSRFTVFPELERTGNERVTTLTQGQTEFYFPEGYAVPLASDEEWKFTFQAANRTTDKHRRIKHLCTLYFSKDSELKKPLKALHWYNPYVTVQIDAASPVPEHHGPSCMAISQGVAAPNMVADSAFKDPAGRTLTGHWTVPPGRHEYAVPCIGVAGDMTLADRTIHAVWTHVHPACVRATLSECLGNSKKRDVFNVNVKTKYEHGPELVQIDKIISKEGIELKANRNYEVSAVYDNPEKEALDSMVAFGVFFESKNFVKPDWQEAALESSGSQIKAVKTVDKSGNKLSGDKENCDLYCGIKNKKLPEQ